MARSGSSNSTRREGQGHDRQGQRLDGAQPVERYPREAPSTCYAGGSFWRFSSACSSPVGATPGAPFGCSRSSEPSSVAGSGPSSVAGVWPVVSPSLMTTRTRTPRVAVAPDVRGTPLPVERWRPSELRGLATEGERPDGSHRRRTSRAVDGAPGGTATAAAQVCGRLATPIGELGGLGASRGDRRAGGWRSS